MMKTITLILLLQVFVALCERREDSDEEGEEEWIWTNERERKMCENAVRNNLNMYQQNRTVDNDWVLYIACEMPILQCAPEICMSFDRNDYFSNGFCCGNSSPQGILSDRLSKAVNAYRYCKDDGQTRWVGAAFHSRWRSLHDVKRTLISNAHCKPTRLTMHVRSVMDAPSYGMSTQMPIAENSIYFPVIYNTTREDKIALSCISQMPSLLTDPDDLVPVVRERFTSTYNNTTRINTRIPNYSRDQLPGSKATDYVFIIDVNRMYMYKQEYACVMLFRQYATSPLGLEDLYRLNIFTINTASVKTHRSYPNGIPIVETIHGSNVYMVDKNERTTVPNHTPTMMALKHDEALTSIPNTTIDTNTTTVAVATTITSTAVDMLTMDNRIVVADGDALVLNMKKSTLRFIGIVSAIVFACIVVVIAVGVCFTVIKRRIQQSSEMATIQIPACVEAPDVSMPMIEMTDKHVDSVILASGVGHSSGGELTMTVTPSTRYTHAGDGNTFKRGAPHVTITAPSTAATSPLVMKIPTPVNYTGEGVYEDI